MPANTKAKKKKSPKGKKYTETATSKTATNKRKEKRSDEDVSANESKKQKQSKEQYEEDVLELADAEHSRKLGTRPKRQTMPMDTDSFSSEDELDMSDIPYSSDEETHSEKKERIADAQRQIQPSKWVKQIKTRNYVKEITNDFLRTKPTMTTEEIGNEAGQLQVQIINALFSEKHNTRLEAAREILPKLSEIMNLLRSTLIQNTIFEHRLTYLNQTADNEETSHKISPTVLLPTKESETYAGRLGLKSRMARLATRREDPPNIVKIVPDDAEKYKSSDKTKERVKQLITPNEVNLQVRNVKHIQGNGILVETSKKENVEALLASEKLRKAGLSVGIPAKKNPRLIIYDVPALKDDDSIVKAIVDQNANEQEGKMMRQQMRILFKTGARDKDVNNIILEVSKNVRDLLIKKDRLYIGWSCCRIQDYLAVTRCYKCQGYGHTSKYCLGEKDICGHCSENGHSFKICKNKTKPATCHNCKKQGKPSDHVVTSNECTAYISALNQLIIRTDYGV